METPIATITTISGPTIRVYATRQGVRIESDIACSVLSSERDGGTRPHRLILDNMQTEVFETALRVARKGSK